MSPPGDLPREPSEILGGKLDGSQQLDQWNIVQRVSRVWMVEFGEPPQQLPPGLNVNLGPDQSPPWPASRQRRTLAR